MPWRSSISPVVRPQARTRRRRSRTTELPWPRSPTRATNLLRLRTAAPGAAPPAAPRPAEREGKESLIAADLSIEGKIQGAGHIRIAGRFKGDVHVEGDLTIEVGAKVTGGVRARKVIIAGELEGNIESAQRVELLEGGVVVGDVKAGSVTVAAGSRMRGQVEFGWDEKDAPSPAEATRRTTGARRMSAARPGTPGATRTCPHCKTTILESASVCPACRHHLRFDEAAQSRARRRRSSRCASKARSRHRRGDTALEYSVVLTIRTTAARKSRARSSAWVRSAPTRSARSLWVEAVEIDRSDAAPEARAPALAH